MTDLKLIKHNFLRNLNHEIFKNFQKIKGAGIYILNKNIAQVEHVNNKNKFIKFDVRIIGLYDELKDLIISVENKKIFPPFKQEEKI